jgi:hypothetical protein
MSPGDHSLATTNLDTGTCPRAARLVDLRQFH